MTTSAPTDYAPYNIGERLFSFVNANIRVDWKKTERVTKDEATTFETISRDSLDTNLVGDIVKAGYSSLTTVEAQERVREDSSQRILGGVQSPLDGRVAEHSSGRGEEMVPSYPDKELLSKIHTALNATGYASLSYIARETGLSAEDIKAFISSHSEEFRESFMRAENGDEVYMKNTPLSGMWDAWAAFRHLNAKKF